MLRKEMLIVVPEHSSRFNHTIQSSIPVQRYIKVERGENRFPLLISSKPGHDAGFTISSINKNPGLWFSGAGHFFQAGNGNPIYSDPWQKPNPCILCAKMSQQPIMFCDMAFRATIGFVHAGECCFAVYARRKLFNLRVVNVNGNCPKR